MLSNHAFQRLVKHCIAEVIVETPAPVRKNALVDKDKPCDHPNGFEYSGKIPGTGYKVCRMCGAKQYPDKKQVPRLGMFEKLVKECVIEVLKENLSAAVQESLVLTPTGQSDDWSRPVYTDQSGKMYVDINLGQGTPSIHSVTDEGEPLAPIRNFTIQQGSSKHPNALCPRCKNSKPELMKVLPDGRKSCTYCHWEEPSVDEGFDPLSQGPNPDCKENPYPEWNAHMRSLEEGPDTMVGGVHAMNDFHSFLWHNNFHWNPDRGAYVSKYRGILVINSDGTSTWRLKRQRKDFKTLEELGQWIENLDKMFQSLRENEHGRYAQDAGAGQFDSRTFGVEKDPLSDKLAAIDDREDQRRALAKAKDYVAQLRKQQLK